MNTPVLLTVFNRPEFARKMLALLKLVKPKILYIAADGPRSGRNEEARCKQVKDVLKDIDWDCKVKRLYQTENLGLEKSMTLALNWFFKDVKEGIILEDDCIPDPSFFTFCTDMLQKYRDDTKVMSICGSNFLPSEIQDPKMYYISKYTNFWGWATWRRAWEQHDAQMSGWPENKNTNKFAPLWDSVWEKLYFTILFDATYFRKTNSWGYRWLYSVWKSGGKTIVAGVNLIKNIGFDDDATHFVLRKFELSTRPINTKVFQASNIDSLKYDRLVAKRYYAISPWMVLAQFLFYALKRLSNLVPLFIVGYYLI